MHSSLLPLAIALLPVTLAQYDYGSPSTSTSSGSATTVSGKIHKISVGANNTITFSPNSVTAAVGDYIEWHFFSSTHSVVRSSFNSPCNPVENGFSSGGFTTTGAENANVFRVLVNSTEPLWYYCGVSRHCQGGMVGVVNPSDGTIEQFTAAAATATSGDSPRTVNGGVVGAAGTVAPSSTQSSATPTASNTSGAEGRGYSQILLAFTGIAALFLGSSVV